MSKVKLNVQKCEAIDNEHRRRARQPLLADLDVQFQRALEAGDTKKQQEVVARKNRLRDITKHPSFKTLDEVIQSWPSDELGPCPYTSKNDD